ncbi:transcriptional regulator [Niallia oryzisoli]|uniref:Transcriptional regulator n=1 Tax=Niallia oryzisoli TaxID=1737571 RepID=A0ABZ2CNB2_9BACI
METVEIEKDINVYYINAKSFPEGILDAHEKLHAIIPHSKERKYFGISRPENDGGIVYKAAVEALERDQTEKMQCETLTINKGKYRCITILKFMKDSQSIGKAFSELISYTDIDPNGYCIEYYYTPEDVKCMVRLKDVD